MNKHLWVFAVDESEFTKTLKEGANVGTGDADYLGGDSGLILTVTGMGFHSSTKLAFINSNRARCPSLESNK
jgi:hypothetical protein